MPPLVCSNHSGVEPLKPNLQGKSHGSRNDDDTIANCGGKYTTWCRSWQRAWKELFIALKSATCPEALVRVKEWYKVADLKLKIQKLWGHWKEKENTTLIRLSKKIEMIIFCLPVSVRKFFQKCAVNSPLECTYRMWLVRSKK